LHLRKKSFLNFKRTMSLIRRKKKSKIRVKKISRMRCREFWPNIGMSISQSNASSIATIAYTKFEHLSRARPTLLKRGKLAKISNNCKSKRKGR